jgi:hypothetical protein
MPKKRPVQSEELSKKLFSKFHDYLSIHPPRQVSRHLRCILLDYISAHVNSGFPLDFDIWVWELYDLFELLDCVSEQAEVIN